LLWRKPNIKTGRRNGISPDEVKRSTKTGLGRLSEGSNKEKKFFDSVLANVVIKEGEAKTFLDFMNQNQ